MAMIKFLQGDCIEWMNKFANKNVKIEDIKILSLVYSVFY